MDVLLEKVDRILRAVEGPGGERKMEPNPNIIIPDGGVPFDPNTGIPPYLAGAQVVQMNVTPSDPIVEKLNALIEAHNELDDKLTEVLALLRPAIEAIGGVEGPAEVDDVD